MRKSKRGILWRVIFAKSEVQAISDFLFQMCTKTMYRRSYNKNIVTVQYPHSYGQNPLKIAFGNGIFACKPMFSYGQRSECADLLNSYKTSKDDNWYFYGTGNSVS